MLLSVFCVFELFCFPFYLWVCVSVYLCVACVCMYGVCVQSQVYEYMYLWTHENQNITLCLIPLRQVLSFNLELGWHSSGSPSHSASTFLVTLSFFHEFWRFKFIHLYAHSKSSNLLSHLFSLLVLWMDFCYVTQACLKFADLNFFLPLHLQSLHLKNSIA